MLENFFGIIAFISSVIGLFPQIYKAVRTRSTHDVSMLMLLNFFICSLAWIIYGAYSRSLYVAASNILGLVSCTLLIALKCFYDRRHAKS